MMDRKCVLSIAAAVLFGSTAATQAAAKTLETMGAVGSAIMACWSPPADSKGSSVTLKFSLKRDGTLFGEPRPTDIAVKGDNKARKAFVQAAVDAVRHCTPLNLSDALAKGIGGNVFTLNFQGGDGDKDQNAPPSAR